MDVEPMMGPRSAARSIPPPDRPHLCARCGSWPATIIVTNTERVCEECAANDDR
jgi:hypothetical protein